MKQIEKDKRKYFKNRVSLNNEEKKLSFLNDNLKLETLIRPYYRIIDEFTIELDLELYYPAGHTVEISLDGMVDEKYSIELLTPLKHRSSPRTSNHLYGKWEDIILVTAREHSFPIGMHSFELSVMINIFDSDTKHKFFLKSINFKNNFEVVKEFPKNYIVPIEDKSLLEESELNIKFSKNSRFLMFDIETFKPIKVGIAYRIEVLDENKQCLFRGEFGVPPNEIQSFSGPIITPNTPKVLFLKLIPDLNIALFKNTRMKDYLNIPIEKKSILKDL